jgi:hypothetical protein
MYMCLTIGDEEEGRSDVGVVHRGIPHDRACPPSGGAHDSSQYP